MSTDVQEFIDGLHEYLRQAFAPVVARVTALEARAEALESAPLKYLGTYEGGRVYPKHGLVSYGGSMWIALRVTQQKPGDGGDGWQLCVKAGRDAR